MHTKQQFTLNSSGVTKMNRVFLTYAMALAVLSLLGVGPAWAQGPPSPVAYWRMNEGSGNTILDASGNGNHGTIYGASWTTNGAHGTALNFDGMNDYVDVPYSASYDNVTDLTLMAWIKADRAGCVLARDGYPSYPRAWFMNAQNFWADNVGWFNNPWPPIDESWHHVAMTYDYIGAGNSLLTLYVDGNNVASWSNAGGPLNKVSQIGLRIGASSWDSWGNPGWAHFKGVIDEIAIFDRALSPAQVMAKYQEVTPDQPPVAKAGADQILRYVSGSSMNVTLDGTESYDPEGSPLTYHWTWDDGEAFGPAPTVSLPLGSTTLKLLVNDGRLDSRLDLVNVTIVDFTSAQWPYRQPILIGNDNDDPLADFETLVMVNTATLISAGKMQSDGDDIRFMAPGFTPLAYWVDSGMNTTQSKIWVSVPSIPAHGAVTIYMYYGNPSATSRSSGEATFTFFDDFMGNTLNRDKWDYLADPGPVWVEVANSDLHLKTDGYQFDPPGLNVWSKLPVMPGPLIMETIGNLYVNTGSNVACQVVLNGSPGGASTVFGASCEYYSSTNLRWWVLHINGSQLVNQTTRPTSRFRSRYVVKNDGAVQFYLDGTFIGQSSITIPTGRPCSPHFGLMWKTDYKLDKILFRKYASIDPTVTFGEEQVNHPPVANAGTDQTVEANVHHGAQVTLDGSNSSDPDDDLLTYTWREAGDTIAGPTNDPTAQITLALGTHTIELIVNDGKGGAATDEVRIEVKDTTSPTLSVILNPNNLWPPNHKMVRIHATVEASDICDPAPSVILLSITSDEPDNGLGDGDKPNDIQGANFGTTDYDFQLRAERAGSGDGREYTVTYRVTDKSGNFAEESAMVTVAHDMGKLAASREITATPESFALLGSYPNPFNAETVIRYQLPKTTHVTLLILNPLGQEIRRLVDMEQEPGDHIIRWDGRDDSHMDVASGVYWYQLRANGFAATKKFLLMR
jgi:hypothetical protein